MNSNSGIDAALVRNDVTPSITFNERMRNSELRLCSRCSASQSYGRAIHVLTRSFECVDRLNPSMIVCLMVIPDERTPQFVCGRIVSRGVTVSGKIAVARFAMTQVLWPQEAQWRLGREPADILDSPVMESIRKWFYRPKVRSFRFFLSRRLCLHLSYFRTF